MVDFSKVFDDFEFKTGLGQSPLPLSSIQVPKKLKKFRVIEA
ncbi:hypothetical protein X924_02535 [Petrotoga sp. 9PWA.NaAc.5.4]|nr:hypothetical protein X924_02535 [Petrotoga sp. 9PWA.NaAc.5.4]